MTSIFFRTMFPVKKLPGRQGAKKAHGIGLKDLISKAGRKTEQVTFQRLQKKFPGDRSKIRAYKIAKIKGEKKVQSLTKRLGTESPASIKTQYKSKGKWTFKEQYHDVKGTRKLRRFKAYMLPKRPAKITGQSKTQKTFLRDDDPTNALKSMRLDREGSHMRGLPTEPRHTKGVGDVIDWDYNKYKKSEFLKMSKGIGAKGQKPFTNAQKVTIMEKGKKGLERHIDRELSSGTTKIVSKFHAVKHGKKWTKSFGKFRVPAKEISGVKYPIAGPPEYVTKKRILDPRTRKKIGEKITGSGTYKWRKGRKKKIYSIE